MVVWIIGLSGTGKTTLANEIVAQVRKKQKNVILLDGDLVREVFANDLGHSLEDRHTNAKRICQLGKLLDEQDIHVVCAILSLFPDTREWNRANLRNYYEVFIDTPMPVLEERDSKGIYSRFRKGEIHDVAGMDLEFLPPTNADIVIRNNGSKNALLEFAEPIVDIMLAEQL